jgi:hypothetical protein
MLPRRGVCNSAYAELRSVVAAVTELMAASVRTGTILTPHEAVVERAEAAVKVLNARLASANAAGLLQAVNREFKRRRLAAERAVHAVFRGAAAVAPRADPGSDLTGAEGESRFVPLDGCSTSASAEESLLRGRELRTIVNGGDLPCDAMLHGGWIAPRRHRDGAHGPCSGGPVQMLPRCFPDHFSGSSPFERSHLCGDNSGSSA